MAEAPMIPKWMLTIFAFLAMKPMLSNSTLNVIRSVLLNELNLDLYYTTMELICEEGYPAQEHKVVSQDGYVIAVHRIPNGNRKERVTDRGRGYTSHHHHVHPAFYRCLNESLWERASGPPVIMQHGFVAASDSWVLQGAGKDLAYLLADAGYDVWLGNARGNFYSRTHTYLSTESKKYWDFSFHESGTLDLPAVIDYVLKETGHKQVYYIGHSMGTTQVLILGSTRPEYMQKIRLASLMAPVGNLSESFKRGREKIVPDIIAGTAGKLENRGKYELAQRQNLNSRLMNPFCMSTPFVLDLCYDIITGFGARKLYNIERGTFAKVLTHLLSGSSTKTVAHAMQLLRTNIFQEYDYGPEINYKVYNQATPRKYNVSRVTCPVAIYYSDSDVFVSPEHARILEKQLPNVVFSKDVTDMLHTDFIFARNAKEKVYDDILKLMSKY